MGKPEAQFDDTTVEPHQSFVVIKRGRMMAECGLCNQNQRQSKEMPCIQGVAPVFVSHTANSGQPGKPCFSIVSDCRSFEPAPTNDHGRIGKPNPGQRKDNYYDVP